MQWYNTTGIIPQLYIHTYSHNSLLRSLGEIKTGRHFKDQLNERCEVHKHYLRQTYWMGHHKHKNHKY